jgi:hypothetical protein
LLLLMSVLAILTLAACSSDEPSQAQPLESGDESALPDGEAFSDPQGTYEITVASAWEENHGGFVAEIEVWFVAEPVDGFAPNVNILTQTAPGMDTSKYLELSIDGAPAFISDFDLLEQSLVEGANGQTLATMEYTGDGLQYLGVFTVSSGQAVVATLTAPPDRFEALREEILPYLLTLTPS